MRIIDVLSTLSTVAGLPSLFRTANTCIDRVISQLQTTRWRLFALLFICLVCLSALQGCAGLAVSEPGSSVDRQPSVKMPLTIRTLDTEHRFSQLSSTTVAERLRALHPGETLNILALSGGGGAGAFGAGAVTGLTRSGSRPDFAVVTGVSAGALIAPYAFLGRRERLS
jgi:hypothetical protein